MQTQDVGAKPPDAPLPYAGANLVYPKGPRSKLAIISLVLGGIALLYLILLAVTPARLLQAIAAYLPEGSIPFWCLACTVGGGFVLSLTAIVRILLSRGSRRGIGLAISGLALSVVSACLWIVLLVRDVLMMMRG